MATIDDYQIPDDLIVEFERIIDNISPVSLKRFIISRPSLVKGFRSSHLQAKVIRQRLKSLLKASGQLDLGVVALLEGESLDLEIIAVLSKEALSLIFTPCASYFGSPFVAAALLDDRHDVREMAIEYWHNSGGGKGEGISPEEAALILQQELKPFLEHMLILAAVKCGDGEGVVRVSSREVGGGDSVDVKVVEQYRAKISRLEGHLAQGKEAMRLSKVLNEKIKGKETEIKALHHKFSQEQKMRYSARKEAGLVLAELNELKDTLTQKIRIGVAEELSSVVHGWLKTPRLIEKKALSLDHDTCPDDNLLARAENVLRRQAFIDRNSGNRKILSERLAGLEDIRDRVLNATRNALQPLPELWDISAAIEEEISSLNMTLGLNVEVNSTLLKMHSRINQASNASELTVIKKLLSDLGQAEIFTRHELTALYDSYQDRQDILYDQYGCLFDGAPPLDGVEADILRVTAEKKPFHLVLDGHNIILDSGGMFPDIFVEDGAGSEARNWLLTVVDRMLQGSSCHATVFFDGSFPSVRSYSTQVKEIFSGGGGVDVKNRADDAIVSYLASLNVEGGSPLPVIVVTNDRELQGLVREKGARIMPLAQFAVLTRRYHV